MCDELLDLVNENDQVIGQMPRSEVHAKKLSNYRVINVFLMNEAGKLWIPRRAQDKALYPLCLDASTAGHVASGETYEQALIRELMEEVRIDATSLSYKFLGALNPHEHYTTAFMKVYLLFVNDVPDYNPNDFVEYFWLTPQELLRRLAGGDKGKKNLSRIIEELFFEFSIHDVALPLNQSTALNQSTENIAYNV
jgi:isopentenyldiphosphate isomerase